MKLRRPIIRKYKSWCDCYPYYKRFFESAYHHGFRAYSHNAGFSYNILSVSQQTQAEREQRLSPKISVEIKPPAYIELDAIIINCTKNPKQRFYLCKEIDWMRNFREGGLINEAA